MAGTRHPSNTATTGLRRSDYLGAFHRTNISMAGAMAGCPMSIKKWIRRLVLRE